MQTTLWDWNDLVSFDNIENVSSPLEKKYFILLIGEIIKTLTLTS